jgi:hypothetical protein
VVSFERILPDGRVVRQSGTTVYRTLVHPERPPDFADYDLLAEKTDLKFDSVWLADRGSL